MKIKTTIILAILLPYLLPSNVLSQTKWEENDDMYFSRLDREKAFSEAEANDSEYASTHDFNSSTEQYLLDDDDEYNEYFISDYSLPKDKKYEKISPNSYGSSPSYNNRPNVNFVLRMGIGFGYPHYGYNDPFNSFYDPWSYSYRYDPWRYNNYSSYGYNSGYYNSSSCYFPKNGYTNYSSNVRNEVRYRNGRKIISRSRTSTNTVRTSEHISTGIPIKNADAISPTNGRKSTNGSRSSYRNYKSASPVQKVNSTTRDRSNWNRSTNQTTTPSKSTGSSYRNSGSSSGSRSSGVSSGGGRSSGSNRSSRPTSSSSTGRSRDN